MFRIKPHSCQQCSEGSNKPCVHQDLKTETELYLSISCGLLQGQGLWVQQTWIWLKPSWRRSPLIHHRAARTYTRLGKQTLEGHKQKLVCTRTHEKGAVTPKETDQTCPAVSRSLQQRHGSVVACCSVGGTECSSVCMGPFEEGPIVFITSTIVWPQVKNREGTQLYPSIENEIKDLLNMPPPIRIRPSFPLSESLPPGSFHKPLIFLHQRADRLKATITESETI